MKLKFRHLAILFVVLFLISSSIIYIKENASAKRAKEYEKASNQTTININDYSQAFDNEVKTIKDDLVNEHPFVDVSYSQTDNKIDIIALIVDDDLCNYARKLYSLGNGEDEVWQQMKYKLQDYSQAKYEELKSKDLPIGKFVISLLNNKSIEAYKDTNGQEDYSILKICNGDVLLDIVFDYVPSGPGDGGGASNVEPTVGMKNAVKKAQSYISHSAFSREGLIKQLEYEKFTYEEAVYGADNCGANWYDEAAEKAYSYMSHSSFSYERLIDQLKYEGFTADEAKYGANEAYR